MHTLNQPSRKKATYKFAIIYACSLLGVLLLSYLLFSTPSKIVKGQLKKFSDVKMQHDALLGKTDSITNHLADLIEVERIGETSSDPGIDSLIDTYRQKISGTVESIRKDSANNAFSLLKDELTGYLTAYRAILSPLKKPGSLGTLSPPPEPIVKPQVDDKTPATIKELQASLQDALQKNQVAIQQNTDYREQVKKLNEQVAKLSKPTYTNETTTAPAQWVKDNQELQAQVNTKTTEIARLNARINDLENKPATYAPSELNAAEKAVIKIQAIDQLISAGLAKGDPAKRICAEARRMMQESKANYSNQSAYSNTLAKVNRFCEVQ